MGIREGEGGGGENQGAQCAGGKELLKFWKGEGKKAKIQLAKRGTQILVS